jgi:hypothetical protein
MSLVSFVEECFRGPRARVAPPPAPEGEDLPAARLKLQALEAEARLDAPLDPPPYDEGSALDAALLLYRAAQALVFRALSAAEVEAALRPPAPRPGVSPESRAWSADVPLRALADLHALARAASPEDPLTGALGRLAAAFPLSGVGVEGAPAPEPAALDAILAHPSLARAYRDRVIARGDRARLADARVRALVLEALGDHAGLAPALALEEAAP